MNVEPTYKIAKEKSEFDQIYRLNYKTFVEEIPQHPPNPDRILVDRFDHENTYLIGVHQDQLVCMIAVRDKRPFSLDQKLENLDSYLPPGRSVCELRLLSVDKRYRTGQILVGLFELVSRYSLSHRYDLAIMSGILKQQDLYKLLGFVPFGPLVGTGEATFQPMYLMLEAGLQINL